jgi:hypothetical protein
VIKGLTIKIRKLKTQVEVEAKVKGREKHAETIGGLSLRGERFSRPQP